MCSADLHRCISVMYKKPQSLHIKAWQFKLNTFRFFPTSAGKTTVFSHTCEEALPNSITGGGKKPYVHHSL